MIESCVAEKKNADAFLVLKPLELLRFFASLRLCARKCGFSLSDTRK
jgi:hypothetical protein